MLNYIILDLETKNPGLVMQFQDDTSAIRAAKIALRNPQSSLASFPEKFQIVCLGKLDTVRLTDMESTYVFNENRPLAENLTPFVEAQK